MVPPRTSRRSILRSGGGLATLLATGGLAGCIGGLDGGGGATSGSAVPSAVPSSVDAISTVDVNALLADDGLRSVYNAWLAARAETPVYDGPTTVEGVLEEFAFSEDVDVRDLASLTWLYDFGDGATASLTGTGAIIEGAWDVETVQYLYGGDAIEFAESSYEGYTVYEAEANVGILIGVLADGRYVLARRPIVEATIDVDRGASDPLDGPVTDAYRAAPAGPMRYAAAVQEWWFPEGLAEEADVIDLEALRALETTGGGVYQDGDVRGLELRFGAPDAATAREVEAVVDGALALGADRAAADGSTPAFLVALLEDATVGRDGTAVTVTVERTIAELEAIASDYGGDVGSTESGSDSASGSESADGVPAVRFDWDYDAEAGTVTITHEVGDSLDARECYVRGSGFATRADADMTGPGRWAGRTDDGSIQAGNDVVVGVTPAYDLRVVWVPESGDTTAVLSQRQGPDA